MLKQKQIEEINVEYDIYETAAEKIDAIVEFHGESYCKNSRNLIFPSDKIRMR